MYEIEPKLDAPIYVRKSYIPSLILWIVDFIFLSVMLDLAANTFKLQTGSVTLLSLWVLMIIINTVFSYFVGMYIAQANVKRQKEKIIQERIKKAKQDTLKARALLKTTEKLLETTIPALHSNIDNDLLEAQQYFEQKFYSPFWDCIERIAIKFVQYHNELNNLKNLKNQYKQTLMFNKYNFPDYPPSSKLAPIDGLNDKFLAIVRTAQSNFEFASIWEHRKTNKILIGGFETLENAIYNVGDAIRVKLTKFT